MKENSKNHLIQTALQLFAHQGFENTSIKQIAQTARVAQGLLYNYFKSKEELLLAIFEQGFEQVQISMQAYQNEPNPRAAIIQHLELTFQLVQNQREFWKLLHTVRLQNPQLLYQSEKGRAMLQFIQQTLTENFSKLGLRQASEEAQLFFALIDGVVIHYLLEPDNYPLENLKNLIIQKYANL